MLPALRQFLLDHQICSGRLLVGVSGGADSVALLRGLCEFSPEFQLELIVGHFDHALREDSSQDADWVANLGASLGLQTWSERSSWSPSPEVNSSGGTPPIAEETLRRLRYDFFLRAASQCDCRWVAVAHTADDQVETVLHHVLRGSGLKGLSGIPQVRELDSGVLLIRPLLNVSRSEIERYLQSLQQQFCTDTTNADRNYTRNRIRHELLPWLRSEFNPQIDLALRNLAEQSRDAQQTLNELARTVSERAILNRDADLVQFDRVLLATQPVGLLRELLRIVWESQNWPRQSLGFAHLNRVAEMVRSGTPRQLSLPSGITAGCRGNLLELRRKP